MRRMMGLCITLTILILAAGVLAQTRAEQLSEEMDKMAREAREELSALKVLLWAPAPPGEYVALSELKIKRFRIQPMAWVSRDSAQRPIPHFGHAQQPFPRFTVVLTLV